MASTVVSTLYPPLVDTFQPAFIYTDSVLVTFSLSPFNSIADIKRVHVSVVDQRNNSNVLKGFLSPKEQTINSESTGKYYSIINGILIADLPVFENEEQTEEVGIFCYDPINDIYAVKIDPI